MGTENLPELTKSCLTQAQNSNFTQGFVLIGGTALALSIGHRVSEDLDLAFLEETLPKKRIDLFIKQIESLGLSVQRQIDIAAQEDFIDSGLDINDYQQDFLVVDNKNDQKPATKISFVCFDLAIRSCLKGSKEDGFRIASLDEIFATKAIASANRTKARDWFDIYMLINHHGFSFADFYDVFRKTNNPLGFDIAAFRLSQGRPSDNDEGLLHLMQEPPTVDEMQFFFSEGFSEFRKSNGLHSSI